jgi:excisionase family DNA binding protein
VVKNRIGQHRWTTCAEVQTLIVQLARQLNDGSIASLLNRLGHVTGKGQTWTQARVRAFRCDHHIPVYKDGERVERSELTLEQAAERLGTSRMTVLRMISAGTLPASQACKGAPWVIKADHLLCARECVTSADLSKHPLPQNTQQISLDFQ